MRSMVEGAPTHSGGCAPPTASRSPLPAKAGGRNPHTTLSS
jgi:hypothetical protein